MPQEFLQYIRSLDWSKLFLATDVNSAAAQLYSHLQCYFQSALPPIVPNLHQVKKPFQRLQRKLQMLRSQATYSADIFLRILISKSYTRLLNLTSHSQQTEEKKALAAPCPSNSLSQLLKKRARRDTSISSVILPDNTITEDASVICEAFSAYFAACQHPAKTDFSPTIPHYEPVTKITSVNITLNQVRSLCRTAKKSYYPGPDGLPSSILTDTPDDVPLLLLSLFNLSLKTYTFPDAWKCSTIHPRHKSGPTNIISNYRPICHISTVAKLLERIVNDALLAHLSSISFFVAAQHGFLKRRSTTTCQLAFMDLVTSSIDAVNRQH